jgi:hypothetical protein
MQKEGQKCSGKAESQSNLQLKGESFWVAKTLQIGAPKWVEKKSKGKRKKDSSVEVTQMTFTNDALLNFLVDINSVRQIVTCPLAFLFPVTFLQALIFSLVWFF